MSQGGILPRNHATEEWASFLGAGGEDARIWGFPQIKVVR